MKCPYRDFADCIVEQCPSCNYEERNVEVTEGRCPACMSNEKALELGYIWKATRTRYEFVSCKLIDSGVQPVPPKKEIINNTQKTSVVIHKSIF